MSADSNRRGPKSQPASVRFWSHVDTSGDCWIWIGSLSRRGYGLFNSGNRFNVYAHRFAYELSFGPVPDGLFICHHCDTPACCNPDHLFAATHLENMEDMRRKGRSPKGEQRSSAKLTWAIVAEIRSRAALERISNPKLGKQYGVGKEAVRRILLNETWKI